MENAVNIIMLNNPFLFILGCFTLLIIGLLLCASFGFVREMKLKYKRIMAVIAYLTFGVFLNTYRTEIGWLIWPIGVIGLVLIPVIYGVLWSTKRTPSDND